MARGENSHQASQFTKQSRRQEWGVNVQPYSGSPANFAAGKPKNSRAEHFDILHEQPLVQVNLLAVYYILDRIAHFRHVMRIAFGANMLRAGLHGSAATPCSRHGP